MEYAVRVSHYLEPATLELQRDVILLIDGDRVVETIIGGEVSGGLKGLARQTLELEAAVAMPGFVNCHAHLDLSHLHGQVPAGLKFHEWVPAILAGRTLPESMIKAGIDDACRMLVAGGTTAVLDVSVDGSSAPALSEYGLRATIALEVLGNAEQAMQKADAVVRSRFRLEHERLGSDVSGDAEPDALPGVDYGFSPHAPYSTGQELYQLAYGRAFGDGRVCTTHLAETREELEFIDKGTGPLRDLLQRVGADVLGFDGHGTTPVQLVLSDWLGPWLGDSNPGLVLVHCNYLSPEDVALISRVKPSVCWCPRSHRWFVHEPWPLYALFDSGANVVIGTDSLASNEGLDMWGELRAAGMAHPDAPRLELLRMATVNGRKALGIAQDAADIAIWALPDGTERLKSEPLVNQLILQGPPLVAAFSQGRLIARSI
jgi:aminodeoxyfutalosine deaminase